MEERRGELEIQVLEARGLDLSTGGASRVIMDKEAVW